MFKEARIKLTAWYLVIIMAISLSFSCAIYAGVDRELVRMDNMRKDRQSRIETIENILLQKGFPPPKDNFVKNKEMIKEARVRIITSLGIINLSILFLSGVGGYFLAGLTLDPIQKMVKEQKEFIGNASHELRTPITSLKTEIEVALRDKNMNLKSARELLKSNLEDVEGIQELSNYLLKLNHFDNFDNKIEILVINLGKIVSDVVDTYVPIALQKNIKITKKIQDININGNEESVKEITSILIDNAIKYSGKSKKIEVSTKKDGSLLVRDFGIGIKEKDLPHIFDRFYRADSSRSKENVEGFGLGLSIAKSIAEKINAKISVQSKEGKESTFVVEFPKV